MKLPVTGIISNKGESLVNFNLHLANETSPHTFDTEPKSVFLAVRVYDGDISVKHFVSVSSLSPELQKQVLFEIQADPGPRANKPSMRTLAPLKANGEKDFRGNPKTFLHENLDSFLRTLAECRAGTGEVLSCDNPRSRRIGFVYHPLSHGDSFLHEIPLKAAKSTTVSEEIAALLGIKKEDAWNLLASEEGRCFLQTGKSPEPKPSLEQDALLAEAMMAEPLKAEPVYDGDCLVGVEFPDYNLGTASNLVRLAELANPAPKFRWPPKRPDWLPEGWSVLSLPEDDYRVGVQDDLSPVGAHGIFVRRADRLFRAFEDGRWDASQWAPPIKDRTVPGGYKIYLAGHVGKPDILAAFEAVLPEYNLTPSALVRV